MEKDNIKENEINKEVEDTEAETLNAEVEEAASEVKEEVLESTVNDEVKCLVDEENEETDNKESAGKSILANILDQLILVACSSLIVVLCELILKLFGYMFIKGNGSIIFAGGIIYFIINCFYAPIMEKTKLRNTIAKKILSI